MTSTVQDQPLPRREQLHRFWWLKRLSISAAVFFVVLLVLRLIDGWYTQRQLDQRIAALVAAGEPTRPEQLNPTPGELDKPNGYDLFQAAWAKFDQTVESPSNISIPSIRTSIWMYPDYPPYPPAWIKAAEASEKANGPAMDLMETIGTFDRWDSGVRFSSPMSMILLPHLSRMHTMADCMADSAKLHLQRGENIKAFKRLKALQQFARLSSNEPITVSMMSSSFSSSSALEALQSGIPLLTISESTAVQPSTLGNFPTTPRSRESVAASEVKELIEELLDDRPIKEAADRAASFELIYAFSEANVALGSTWITRPAHLRQIIKNIDVATTARALNQRFGINEPTTVAINDLLASNSLRFSSLPKLGSGLYIPVANALAISPTSYARLLLVPARVATRQRLVAIALAVRWYGCEHPESPWPTTLSELVPRYLPYVPQDPYRPGSEIGFTVIRGGLPDGGDRVLLYVGSDDSVPPPATPVYDFNFPRLPPAPMRQYRDLKFWTLPQLPASKDGDDTGE